MNFLVLAAQSKDEISLLLRVDLTMVRLGRGSLLAGFQLGKVLRCEQI